MFGVQRIFLQTQDLKLSRDFIVQCDCCEKRLFQTCSLQDGAPQNGFVLLAANFIPSVRHGATRLWLKPGRSSSLVLHAEELHGLVLVCELSKRSMGEGRGSRGEESASV